MSILHPLLHHLNMHHSWQEAAGPCSACTHCKEEQEYKKLVKQSSSTCACEEPVLETQNWMEELAAVKLDDRCARQNQYKNEMLCISSRETKKKCSITTYMGRSQPAESWYRLWHEFSPCASRSKLLQLSVCRASAMGPSMLASVMAQVAQTSAEIQQ